MTDQVISGILKRMKLIPEFTEAELPTLKQHYSHWFILDIAPSIAEFVARQIIGTSTDDDYAQTMMRNNAAITKWQNENPDTSVFLSPYGPTPVLKRPSQAVMMIDTEANAMLFKIQFAEIIESYWVDNVQT